MGQRGAWTNVNDLLRSFGGSISVSAPAALLATLLAVPLAYLSRRHASTLTHALERSAYIGYATPALALALGWVVIVLRAAPWAYQTAALLVFAYTLHFLAQAIGPVRAAHPPRRRAPWPRQASKRRRALWDWDRWPRFDA
jgi:iron(III) transport system permease protein